MGLSKSELLLTLLVFYSILSVVMGFVGASLGEDLGMETKNQDRGIMVFENIITGFSSVPWWLNTILFVPLVTILVWIVVSSLPTINGGS